MCVYTVAQGSLHVCCPCDADGRLCAGTEWTGLDHWIPFDKPLRTEPLMHFSRLQDDRLQQGMWRA